MNDRRAGLFTFAVAATALAAVGLFWGLVLVVLLNNQGSVLPSGSERIWTAIAAGIFQVSFSGAVALAGAIATSIFFAYKVSAGWLLINLSVSLELKRERGASENEDHLVVTAILEKGSTDAARLISAHLHLSTVDGVKIASRELVTIRRLPHSPGHEPIWDGVAECNPYLNLAPSEKLIVAEYFAIPTSAICRVQIVASGDRFRDRILPSFSQWRSCAISLPLRFDASPTLI